MEKLKQQLNELMRKLENAEDFQKSLTDLVSIAPFNMSHRTSIFRRTLCVALLIALASASIIAKQQPQTAVAENRLPEAEKLADRFVQRFAETLDYGIVYDEFFVSDKELRLKEAASMLGSASRQQEQKREFGQKLIERAYVALRTQMYLNGLYLMNHPAFDDENAPPLTENQDIEYEYRLLPSEIIAAMRASRYFNLMLKKSCCNDGEEEFRTAKDVEDFVRDATKINALFRKHMPAKLFDSVTYKKHLGEMVYHGEKSRVDRGDNFFDIPKEKEVYVVVREIFYFRIVDENGKLKVLSTFFSQ